MAACYAADRLASTEETADLVPWPDGRLGAQLRFLLETDRLKGVLRQTVIADGSRHENSAEHSWQLALFAFVLAEHAPEPIDAGRVVSMLVVHDLVEIDAGDTYIYDQAAQATRAAREQAAADRLFGLLPADQGAVFRGLWEEYEEQGTPEARFAAAMDRLAPVLLNFVNRGLSWRRHGVPATQVRTVNGRVGAGAPALGEFVQAVISEAVRQGWLSEE